MRGRIGGGGALGDRELCTASTETTSSGEISDASDGSDEMAGSDGVGGSTSTWMSTSTVLITRARGGSGGVDGESSAAAASTMSGVGAEGRDRTDSGRGGSMLVTAGRGGLGVELAGRPVDETGAALELDDGDEPAGGGATSLAGGPTGGTERAGSALSGRTALRPDGASCSKAMSRASALSAGSCSAVVGWNGVQLSSSGAACAGGSTLVVASDAPPRGFVAVSPPRLMIRSGRNGAAAAGGGELGGRTGADAVVEGGPAKPGVVDEGGPPPKGTGRDGRATSSSGIRSVIFGRRRPEIESGASLGADRAETGPSPSGEGIAPGLPRAPSPASGPSSTGLTVETMVDGSLAGASSWASGCNESLIPPLAA